MSGQADKTYNSYFVGNARVHVVSDGFISTPLAEGMVSNASLENVRDALNAAELPSDRLITTFAPVIVQVGSQKVLIDTGLGPDIGAEEGSTKGLLTRNMRANGLDPLDIDIVVISHFHADHANGLLSREGPVFPRARILVPERELQFWMDDAEMARAPSGRMSQLFANNRRLIEPLRDRIEIYRPGEEVIGGLEAIATYGHSVGHMSYWLRSGSDCVFIQSDLTNQAALFLPNPDWQSPLDQFPEEAVRVRRRTYDMLAREGIALQAFHHPFPGRCYLERQGDGYRRVPLE